MSDILSVRQAVLDAWKIPDVALEQARITRAICQALESLRAEEVSFNSTLFTLITVADQANYGRDVKGGSSTTKLPWNFWGVLGREIYLVSGGVGTRKIRAMGRRRLQEKANRGSPTTGVPIYFATENHEVRFVFTPAAAYTLSGRCLLDLGTPVPIYTTGTVASVSQGWQEDNSGPTYVDVTAALLDLASTAAPFPAGSGNNDAFHLGFSEQRASLTVVVGTAGVGTYTVTWKYWNGSSWVALAGVTDGTGALKNSGSNTVVYTLPTDWAPYVVNSSDKLYYLKCERDGGTVTTDPLVTSVTGAGIGTWEYYLRYLGGSEKIGDSYTNDWFTRAFQVLVAKSAAHYFMSYARDKQRANDAQGLYLQHFLELRKTEAPLHSVGDFRPWLGGP